MTLLLMLLLKSFLVFGVSGAALLCLRRASASARHLACLLTLAALLALPLFSLALPGWPVAALKAQTEPTPVRPLPIRSNPFADTLPKGEGKEFKQEAHSVPAASSSASSPLGKPPAKQGGGFFTQGGGFLALYLLGLLLASTRPLLGLWGIARLRRACVSVTDAPTLRVSADCAAALRLTRLPQTCRADVPVPLTWGGRRPVIVLPSGSEAWPEDRLRSVLLHEMAHVKRRDWPCHRLADLACAVYWFHPLVWLTARRLRSESEAACDDLVLSSGIPAPDYARHLLEIASALSRPLPSQSAIAMAQTSRIESRLTMILDKTRSRRTLARRVILAALVPSVAALVTLAILRPDARAQVVPSSVDTQMAGNISVQLAGVTDGNLLGNQWWSATGVMLPNPVYDPSSLTHSFIVSRDYHKSRNLIFAFRLPPTAKDVTTAWELPKSQDFSSGGTWITETEGHDTLPEYKITGESGGTRTVAALYPFSISHADVKVRVASGPWTTVAAQNVRNDWFGTTKSSAAGTFIFSSITKAQYERPAVTITTDQVKQDVRVVAVDIQGHETLPVGAGDQSTGNLKQMTVDFDEDPAKRIVEFRVQTRPFQEVEFKDIPLQPMTLAQPAPLPSSPAPADFRKTYTSGITLSVDALTRLPTDGGGQWWRPDGTLLSGPIAGREASASLQGWSPEQNPRALLFTATAPHDMNYSELTQFFVDGKLIEPVYSFDSTQRIQGGQPSRSSLYRGFPPNATSCSLRYGISAGPWKTVAVRKVHFSPELFQDRGADADKDYNGDMTLELSQQPKLDYKDAGGVLHRQALTAQPLGEVARQIVAVDANGVQTPLSVSGSTGLDLSVIGLAFSPRSVLHNYNPKVDLARVRELRVQTRPYEWLQFNNIALQPVRSSRN